MTQRNVKVEFYQLLDAQLNTQLASGITTTVMFSREEVVQIPDGSHGVFVAMPMNEVQSSYSYGMCPTSRIWPYAVDIFGRDGETVDLMYEDLFSLLQEDISTNFAVSRCERHVLVSQNHQTAAARAVVSLQYVA